MSLNEDQLIQAIIQRRKEHEQNIAKLHKLYVQVNDIQKRVIQKEYRLKGFSNNNRPKEKFQQFLRLIKNFDQYIDQYKQQNNNDNTQQMQQQQQQLQKYYSNELNKLQRQDQQIEKQNEQLKKEIQQMKKAQFQIDRHTEKLQKLLLVSCKQNPHQIPSKFVKNINLTVNNFLPALIKQKSKFQKQIQSLQNLLNSLNNEQQKRKQQYNQKLKRQNAIQKLQHQLKLLEQNQNKLIEQKCQKLSNIQERQQKIEAIVEQRLQIIVPPLLQTKKQYQVLISKAFQFMKNQENLLTLKHLPFLFQKQ